MLFQPIFKLFTFVSIRNYYLAILVFSSVLSKVPLMLELPQTSYLENYEGSML